MPVNAWMLAVAAALPAMVLIPINFESMHGYFAYHLPVSGSTVEIWNFEYYVAAEEDYRYNIDVFVGFNETRVNEVVGKKNPSYPFTISNITLQGDGSIMVDFDDNDHTVYRDGLPILRTPKFSHAETIGVNQTFVAICIDLDSEVSEDSKYYDTTSIAIYQYLGTEDHNTTSVRRYHHVVDSFLLNGTLVHRLSTGEIVPRATELETRGDTMYIVTRELLPHPKTIPVHKFLFMSAYTNTKMPCDYPQVIEHTVDAKKIGPADIRAVDDRLYQWYK